MCTIYALHGFFSPEAQQAEAAAGCRSAGIGCLDCKKILSRNISRELAPIRARGEELKGDPAAVYRVLDEGARKCRTIARDTIREVKQRMGLLR